MMTFSIPLLLSPNSGVKGVTATWLHRPVGSGELNIGCHTCGAGTVHTVLSSALETLFF